MTTRLLYVPALLALVDQRAYAVAQLERAAQNLPTSTGHRWVINFDDMSVRGYACAAGSREEKSCFVVIGPDGDGTTWGGSISSMPHDTDYFRMNISLAASAQEAFGELVHEAQAWIARKEKRRAAANTEVDH